jgi:hypothetical protein
MNMRAASAFCTLTFLNKLIMKSPSPIPFSKETLNIHELGYELGAYAAEQWPSLMHFKKYKGMSYLKYRNAAAKNCLRVLCQPAFDDEFKDGFMIGFEKNTRIPLYVKNADGRLDFAGWDAGQLSSGPPYYFDEESK